MKKSAVALALIALVSTAHAAEIYNKDGNKLDLYGKVKGQHSWSDGKNSDETYARLGFKGETQINNQLTGYGQFETQFDAAKPEGQQDGNKTRLAFAGLNYGNNVSFDYGRNYGIAYDVGAYTDVLSEFGGDSYEANDFNALTSRNNGVATLRTHNLFGLADGVNFGAQYQGNDSSNANITKQHGTGYGFSLGYDNIAESGVSVTGAYSTSELTAKQQNTAIASGKKADFWGVGAKYDANSIYLATMYGESHNLVPVVDQQSPNKDVVSFANKAQHFEAVAAYVTDFGLRPNVAYVHTRAKDANAVPDVTEYVALGADYTFNKNLVADIGYKIDLGDDADNTVTAGLTYQF